MTLDHPGLEATASAPLLIVRFLPCCSLLRVRVWMDDCILAEKLLHQTNNNFNSTQTISSPVQATQPSSTQNSFAMSKLSSSPLSLLLFPGRTPLFSLPPQSKDGRWWLGCQRPQRWMGNSHWVTRVGTMLRIQWFAAVVASTLLPVMLVSLFYCRSNTLRRGGNILFYKHCCP